MEMSKNTKSFQRLKELHSNLHVNKGLLDIVASKKSDNTNNESLTTVDQQVEEVVPAASSSEQCNSNNQTEASLVKAVQNDGAGVKLLPHKIFVGNLSYKLTTSQLKVFFQLFGRVLYAQIIKERIKKRSKGYGFVTFSRESEVQKVLQASEDELILDGRVLRVNRAEKRRRGDEPSTEFSYYNPLTNLINPHVHMSLKLSQTIVDGEYRRNYDHRRPIHENNEIDPKTSIEAFVRNYENSTTAECEQFNEETELELAASGDELDEDIVLGGISSLNDDTLLHIFCLLNIKDRVIIERGLTDSILLSLFRRGCQNLRSLDLSHSSRLLTDYSLYLIGQHCVELQELDLSGVNVTTKSLKDLSSKCLKLKKIHLQRCHDVGEKALWWLFKQCKELEYINVGGNIRITGQCFFMLTEKCKYLIINDCLKLADAGMQLLIKRCPKLIELDISHCLYLTDYGISTLLQGCRNLRKLIFCKPSKDVSPYSLMSMRHLTRLEELQLAQQQAVNDDVLFVIAEHCPNLRFINLEACHNVTDVGLLHLASTLYLNKIIISYLDKVTDTAVEMFAYLGVLTVFHARCCFNITDRAIEQLVLNCPELRELDLSGSEGIRNTSLDLVERHLGGQRKMILNVGGTGISQERALQTHERQQNWSISTQNISDHHLRVDYDPYMDMGRILPEYSDDDEEEEESFDGYNDAEDYLAADDPSMWEYETQWLS